jgi:molybdenum cofactor guanylyltransferase
MGVPKESLPFGANTMLGRVAEVLRECADPVCVVARDREQALPVLPACALVAFDEMPGHGPLAGIATGMRALLRHGGIAQDDAVFVTACDAPLLTTNVVRLLAERLGDHDCAMPFAHGLPQPLCAVYRLSCLPRIDAMLRDGASAPRDLATFARTMLVDETTMRAVDPALHCLRSCNTKAEYEQALAEAARNGNAR